MCVSPRILRVAAVVSCFAILRPIPTFAQELQSPCLQNILGALGGGNNNGQSRKPLEGAIFDHVPPAAQVVMRSPIQPSVEAVYELPYDEDTYKAIFNAPPTAMEKGQMARSQQYAAQFPDAKPSRIRNRDEFETFLHERRSSVIIVVGHNRGGDFAFFGGEPVSLALLAEDCGRAAKLCVFVSCKSTERLTDTTSLGVRRILTLSEGVYIAEKLRAWVQSQSGPMTEAQVSTFLATLEDRSFLKYHVAYVALKGCGVVTAGGVVVAIYIEGAGSQPASNGKS